MKEQFLYARQPVFDKEHHIYGYELLYRNKSADNANFTDGSQATATLLNNFYTGIEEGELAPLAEGPLFFNLTAQLLMSEAFFPVKNTSVVIEILEDIQPSPVLLERIASLRKLGFRFALDDYVFEPERSDFLAVVDYIKIDVLNLDMANYQAEIAELANTNMLLAEKVETREMYDICREMGFCLFQGYYLAAPNTYKGKTAISFKSSSINILTQLQSPGLSVDRAAELIASDVNLVFKILKLVNSPMFPSRREITHLREAIIMLGLEAVIKWVTILVLISESREPPELFRLLLTRAKASELIAEHLSFDEPSKLFSMGLFSGIGVALGLDTKYVLCQLNIEHKTIEAILYETGEDGTVLRAVKAMEHGDWHFLQCFSDELQQQVSELYMTACGWSDELMKLVF